MTSVVCILHGGFPIPGWFEAVQHGGQLYLTVNDPDDHSYGDIPGGASVIANTVPRGFAENVNAALHKVFVEDRQNTACVVNFDLELEPGALAHLNAVLEEQPELGAVGAALHATGGGPTFSVGTKPSPLKEFLRASGLRSPALVARQRRVLRRTRGWTSRNATSAGETRILTSFEYLPWTFLAIRREAWTAVGPLDERFPLYGEDIDWGLRCHQTGWKMGLSDCGAVVHAERATRGPRADALYEVSHLELHRKWGWDANLSWQRRALRVRHSWPISSWTPPLDWALLTNLDAPPVPRQAVVDG